MALRAAQGLQGVGRTGDKASDENQVMRPQEKASSSLDVGHQLVAFKPRLFGLVWITRFFSLQVTVHSCSGDVWAPKAQGVTK